MLPAATVVPQVPPCHAEWHATFHHCRERCLFLNKQDDGDGDASPHSQERTSLFARPPDAAELNAHVEAHLAEQLQSRRVAGRNAPIKAVPDGLEPLEHFAAGLHAKSPLDVQPRIAADLQFAVDRVCELGDKIDSWRQAQMDCFKAALSQLRGLRQSLEDKRSSASRICSPHVDPAAVMLGAFCIAWPDEKLASLVVDGVCPLGPQERFGIYRQKTTAPSASLSDLLEQNSLFRASLVSRSPPKPEQAEAIWTKTLEEQELGLLSQWLSEEDLDQLFW